MSAETSGLETNLLLRQARVFFPPSFCGARGEGKNEHCYLLTSYPCRQGWFFFLLWRGRMSVRLASYPELDYQFFPSPWPHKREKNTLHACMGKRD